MCPSSSCGQKLPVAANATVKPVVDQLVRALASMAVEGVTAAATNLECDSEEILVDVELDGFRYLLIRVAKPSAARISLSPREREIVRMVAQGHPNKVIAGVLNISGWTVCTHLRRIFAKLNVGSRAAMVARLLEKEGVDERFRAMQVGRNGADAEVPSGVRPTVSPKLQARAARR